MHIKDIDTRYGFCFVDAFSLRRRRRRRRWWWWWWWWWLSLRTYFSSFDFLL